VDGGTGKRKEKPGPGRERVSRKRIAFSNFPARGGKKVGRGKDVAKGERGRRRSSFSVGGVRDNRPVETQRPKKGERREGYRRRAPFSFP